MKLQGKLLIRLGELGICQGKLLIRLGELGICQGELEICLGNSQEQGMTRHFYYKDRIIFGMNKLVYLLLSS